jgi:hypothetical protein
MAGMSVKRVFWYNNTSAVLRIYMPGTVVSCKMANLQLQESSFGAVGAPRGLRIVILLCKGADVKSV